MQGGAGLEYLDVGGGLGVDYDGSQTNFESSVNYTLQEYANDVVYHIQSVCDDAGVKHPTIVSESGRAVVAYHSALVFNVLGVSGLGESEVPQRAARRSRAAADRSVRRLSESHGAQRCWRAITTRSRRSTWRMNLFNGGYLPLDQRSLAEKLFWAICRKMQRLVRQMDYVPEDLQGLDAMLADTYFCNFSLFQSMPDSWAIKQLFPVMPIHRLNEQPTHHAVLGDITCDSDGKIDQFIDRRDVKRTLAAACVQRRAVLPRRVSGRRVSGNPRRHAQPFRRHQRRPRQPRRRRATSCSSRSSRATRSAKCSTTSSSTPTMLVRQLRDAVEDAVREGRLDFEEAGRLLRFYEDGLHGYTYLEEPR